MLYLDARETLALLATDDLADVANIRARIQRADAQAVKLSRILDEMLSLRDSTN